MISHSSNCNTEFLQGLLGMDNIRGMMSSLGMFNYSEPYYLVSSMLALQQPGNVSTQNYPAYLANLTHSQVVQMARQIHEELANDPNSNLRANDKWLLNATVLDAYTNIAMTGNTKEYNAVMRKINSQKFFDKKTQKKHSETAGNRCNGARFRLNSFQDRRCQGRQQ